MMLALWLGFAALIPAVDDPPKPLNVCLISGSAEYESDASLSRLQEELEARYPARCILLKARGEAELPGLEALDACDVALFFTRRLTIDGESLAKVRKYAEAGRPIVGVRTASHGFQRWLEFDKLVLGGNYQNHYKNGETVQVRIVPGSVAHPTLAGVVLPFDSKGSLYKNTPLTASDATVLLRGSSPEATEPVAWAREFRGARVFYTSLGAQGDFENPAFRRMLANALFWAARRDVPSPKEGLASPKP
ncbi:MAG: ThuA domain-containing protein [Isosphaeraceae bacterium]